MYKEIKQNDIWMVHLGHEGSKGHEQKGSRPFLVVSNTRYNTASKTPIGFFMSTSTKKANNRFNVTVDMQGVEEYINISQVRTLSDLRFFKKLGYCSDEERKMIINKFSETVL